MRILILTDNQAFDPELPVGKSYVSQLVRRLRADGRSVKVDQFDCLSLDAAGTMLTRLRLYQYDFILLQLGGAERHCLSGQYPDLSSVYGPKAGSLSVISSRFRWQLSQLNLRLLGHQAERMKALRQQLATLLLLVQPYRNQTLLLAPLPWRTGSRIDKLVRKLFLDESRLWDVAGLDTAALLSPHELLFREGTTDVLNDLAHELLGSTLHTLITEQEQALPPCPPADGPRRNGRKEQ